MYIREDGKWSLYSVQGYGDLEDATDAELVEYLRKSGRKVLMVVGTQEIHFEGES